MRSYFDPEFSYQSSRSIIPTFSEYIEQWLGSLTKGSLTVQPIMGESAQNVMKECKNLAIRLIALTMYGDSFNESVSTHLATWQT